MVLHSGPAILWPSHNLTSPCPAQPTSIMISEPPSPLPTQPPHYLPRPFPAPVSPLLPLLPHSTQSQLICSVSPRIWFSTERSEGYEGRSPDLHTSCCCMSTCAHHRRCGSTGGGVVLLQQPELLDAYGLEAQAAVLTRAWARVCKYTRLSAYTHYRRCGSTGGSAVPHRLLLLLPSGRRSSLCAYIVKGLSPLLCAHACAYSSPRTLASLMFSFSARSVRTRRRMHAYA